MRFTKSLLLSATFFLILSFPVLAQYDVDVVEPSYQDGSEVFGIDVAAEEQVSIYPDGCKSIERIVFDFKADTRGEIRIISRGDESPVQDRALDRVYEYCEFQYSGIEADDINSVVIDSKVRKSWLQSEDINEDSVGVYTYNNDDWQYKTTNKDKDNSIYVFYISEIEYTQYIAVAEYQDAGFTIYGLSPWLVLGCCLVLLFLLLLFSIIYSMSGREDRKGGRI